MPHTTCHDVAHALSAELAEYGVSVHRIDTEVLCVLAVSLRRSLIGVVPVWVEDRGISWRVGSDPERWRRFALSADLGDVVSAIIGELS